MSMGRLSVSEQESLEAARTLYPDKSQRGLADFLYERTQETQSGHTLRFRSKATIYGALRRLDAGSLRPGKVKRSLAHA